MEDGISWLQLRAISYKAIGFHVSWRGGVMLLVGCHEYKQGGLSLVPTPGPHSLLAWQRHNWVALRFDLDEVSSDVFSSIAAQRSRMESRETLM